IVYQIQDIRTIFFDKGFKGKIVSYLEKFFLKKVDFLVVSSVEFYNQFFRVRYNFPKENVIVIENKIIGSEHNLQMLAENSLLNITIGYFGVLRCERSWSILKRYAKLNPDKSIYIRGKILNIKGFDKDLKESKNIVYEGPYVSPNDLVEIYSKVDL